MKYKLILLLTFFVLYLSCDEEEVAETTFSIEINNISNTYPMLVSFSITNPGLVDSINFEVNNKLITTIENSESIPLMNGYTLSYSPQGIVGELTIRITGYSDNSQKYDELTIDFNNSFTAINDDIAMINAGNEFLFTKHLITNQNYIDYLNSVLLLLTQDNNVFNNELNQKTINLDYSRIIFHELDSLITLADTTDAIITPADTVITLAYFDISDDEYINHPVVGVTWYGANSYANYFGWRLPTVDNWKYIASGDSTNWKYPYLNKQANHSWVDTSQTNCNYNNDQNDNTTNDVLTFESIRSYFGAVDIIGNVHELTNSKHEESGLNIMVGGSYTSECKFIDENGDGIEDTSFEPPELCLQDSCFTAIWDDVSSKSIGFRCVSDIDYQHSSIELYNDCNQLSSSEQGFGIFIDECGTCENQIANIDGYFCLSDCKGFWSHEYQPENILDDCSECDGGLIFTCNDGVRCTPGDENICPNECAVSYECNYQDISFPCNPKTSLTLGGIFPNQCDDECAQVSNAVEDNICDCENNLFQYYYIDNDADGNGDINSNGLLFCDGQATEGYSTNNDDNDDNCFSNIHDCLGVCDGTVVLDDCGVCGGDNSICFDCLGVLNGTAEEDECGVCNGPGSIYECGCLDISDGNCDCDGNILDCADECGGSAVIDCFNQCAGGNTGIDPYESCGCFESGAINYWCNDGGPCPPPGGSSVISQDLLDCQEECVTGIPGSYIAVNPDTFDNNYYVYNDEDSCCYGCPDDTAANYEEPTLSCSEVNIFYACQYTNYLKIGEITDNTIEILIDNSEDIYGFQFSIDGDGITITGASGGLAENNGFSTSTGPNGVLGLSFSGDNISTTNGNEELLTIINYTNPNDSSICLPISDLFISGEGGSDITEQFIIHHESLCP